MHKGSWLACAVLATGCGGIGSTYQVLIDPAFSHDEQEKVLAALDAWQAAVPVQFTARIATCGGVKDATICTHSSTREAIAKKQGATDGIGLGITLRETAWNGTVDGGEVFIDVPTIEGDYADDFQRIVGHEIGHAMHLDHDAPGNMMAAMATEDAPTPTCTDDAEWYAVRGETARSCVGGDDGGPEATPVLAP